MVKITPSYARDFVARAQALVAAGRPPCPFCLQPLDPSGHICPRANGYRRPLFARPEICCPRRPNSDAALTNAAEIPDEPHPALTAALTDGELQIAGRLANASNATYVAVLTTEPGPIECVYKPIRGERPLWDFPTGTLGLREVAAYEVSRAGGFDSYR